MTGRMEYSIQICNWPDWPWKLHIYMHAKWPQRDTRSRGTITRTHRPQCLSQ